MNSELGSFENVNLKYQFDRPIGPRHLLSLGYRNIETRLTTCDLQVPVHAMNLPQNYDVKPMAVSHAIVAGADFIFSRKKWIGPILSRIENHKLVKKIVLDSSHSQLWLNIEALNKSVSIHLGAFNAFYHSCNKCQNL